MTSNSIQPIEGKNGGDPATAPTLPPDFKPNEPMAFVPDLIRALDRLTESRERRVRAVNLTEATRMLGLKDPKVTRRMVEDKVLRGHHAGRRLLISVQSIDEWLGDHQ